MIAESTGPDEVLMIHRRLAFTLALPLIFAAGATAVAAQTTPRTKMAAAKDDGQWTMPGKDYASTRFSSLAQITAGNAKRLRPLWSFSTGVLGGHEGQPLVVGNMMYVVTPYPNVAYAFDLSKEGYPLKWKYRPNVNPSAIGIACCDLVNRGAFYAGGKLVYNLLDGQTVALDAATGKEIWKTQVADVNKGETTPMAPIVVKDRVIVGTAGGEYGVRGWVKGLDLNSGKIVWTGYNVGPDNEVLVNPDTFKPFYAKGTELSLKSWPKDGWKLGGAPVWGWMSYDPDLDLIYYGTGNPAPWNTDQRPGDNRWATSVLARNPADGSLRWAFQFTPADNWDFDSTQEMILTDLAVNGRTRKVLVHFDKNGYAFTLDRATGELLAAHPYVPVNWTKGYDLKSGRPILDSTKLTGASKGNVKNICPTLEGGKNQQPAAFSPLTKLFYVPTNNMCMDYAGASVSYLAGAPYIGATTPYYPGEGGNMGAFIAYDAASGKKVWQVKEPYPVWSGALVTAGGVAFYGTLDGWFKSVDARTGTVLSKFKVGSGVIGNPITFRGPDGKQYVAIYAGFGGDWFLLSGDVMSSPPDDIRPPATFMPDIARHTSQGGIVWIFGL
jgi:PQQ-dependent dehydrogenase (methanol/ethanol family)